MPFDASGVNWVTAGTTDKTELTISAGAVTATLNYHTIDTELDAASDNLDIITPSVSAGSDADGYNLDIRPVNDARTVVVRHNQNAGNAGNILIPSDASITLANEDDIVRLRYDIDLDTNGAWVVVASGPDVGQAHAAVTVSGTPDYITLSGQDLVRAQIDLTADVTGLLPVANIHADIARDSELHAQSHTIASHSDKIQESYGGTLEDPDATEDLTIGFTNRAITVTEIRAVLLGSATPSVTWTIRHSTDRNATGNEVVTGGTTTTSTTTGSDVTSFNDATIPLNSFIWIETTAKSGTVTEIHITIKAGVD